MTALREGDPAPEVVLGPITRSGIVRYAGAGGDFNPIHHDDEFARAAGMPSIFSMGMLPGGLVAQHVAGWLGLANVRSFGLRFTGQVWPGDELTVKGGVERIVEVDGERLAECAFTVERQTGEVAIQATATALAPA